MASVALVQNIAYLPAGSLVDFAGTSAPAGWLMCDGAAISRTTYADLFAVISTAYGIGDGSTTFNLPDFRGRFARYNDNMGTGAAGRDTGRVHGASQTDLVKEHNVTVEAGANVGNKQFSKLEMNETAYSTVAQGGTLLLRFSGVYSSDTRNNDSTYTRTFRAGDVDAAETRPINLSANKIIKL